MPEGLGYTLRVVVRGERGAGIERLVAIVQELSLARSVEAVQRTVRRAARELTGADGATFVLREGRECHYVEEDAIAPLWKGRRFAMEQCVSGWVMDRGRPAIIPDIYQDERVPIDAYRSTFVKSLVMVPIRPADPIGAIGTYWAAPRVASDEEVRLLQALADSTSIALENVKLYSDLTAAAEAARRAEEEARRELVERTRAEEALRATEQELRQAQKMEAIGQLAGGIAHDFNNMLSVILSYGSLARLEVTEGSPLEAYLEEIRSAANRAAALTQQLLAFSRRQVLERRRVDLNQVVVGLEKMLRPMLGTSIDLRVRTTHDLYPVFSDQGQIEQVLVNLVLNARDAMPSGGTVTVETKNVTFGPEGEGGPAGAVPGDYALLVVSDTGHGMDRETQLRVFEPFFTTKERGKGTGLGLSTAYGIVKQSGGHVWVESEVGKGTTFRICLPRLVEAPRAAHSPPRKASESILLVEDDVGVRMAARAILQQGGYRVVEVASAGEALRVVEEGERLDLLLTDLVMPEMSGTELVRRARGLRPGLKVLCMSGFAADAVVRDGLVEAGLPFVLKPVTPESLLPKVREALES